MTVINECIRRLINVTNINDTWWKPENKPSTLHESKIHLLFKLAYMIRPTCLSSGVLYSTKLRCSTLLHNIDIF